MTEKGRNRFSVVWPGVWMAVLLLSMTASVHANESGYAVLIEQSPIHAGTVNPGLGVLKADVGSTMTLIAMPKPGYRFLYWLGDVSNPSSLSTQVRIDSPKIVVAVYEREEFELPLTELDESKLAGASRGGAVRNAVSLGGGSGLMAYYPEYDYSPYVIDFPDLPDEENDPFPVPEDDFPVPDETPIPEPTALCLLAVGSVLLRLRGVSG